MGKNGSVGRELAQGVVLSGRNRGRERRDGRAVLSAGRGDRAGRERDRRGTGIRLASGIRALTQGGEKHTVSTGLRWELNSGAKGGTGLQSGLGSHL